MRYLGYLSLLLVVLVACQGPSDSSASDASDIEVPDGWVLYQSSNPSYTVMAPADWEFDTTGKMNTAMVLISPADSLNDFFRENVNLVYEDLSSDPGGIDEYLNRSEKLIKQYVTDLQDYTKEKREDQYWLSYTGKQGSVRVAYNQCVMMRGTRAYILNYTSIVGKETRHHANGEKILQGFQLN